MTTMFGKVPRTAAFEHLPGEVLADRNKSPPGNWDLPLFQDEFCGNIEHQHRYWAEPIIHSLLKKKIKRERFFAEETSELWYLVLRNNRSMTGIHTINKNSA